jgi:hypothetical protein
LSPETPLVNIVSGAAAVNVASETAPVNVAVRAIAKSIAFFRIRNLLASIAG